MFKLIYVLPLLMVLNLSAQAAVHREPAGVQGVEVGADLGLGTLISRLHFGFGVRADAPIDLNGNTFRLGGQSGFYVGVGDSYTDWIIPVLAIGTYHFAPNRSFKPYAGIGIGFDIAHALKETNVDFALLIKLGTEFGEDNAYYLELPFGTMAQNFAFIPSVGMRF